MDVRIPAFDFDREGTADYITARRPSRSLPVTSNSYDSRGDRVCIIPLVGGGGQGWLDCSTIKICMALQLPQDVEVGSDVGRTPKRFALPSDLIQQVRVYVGDNDALVEDMPYFNELSQIVTDTLASDVRRGMMADLQLGPLTKTTTQTVVCNPWVLGICRAAKYMPIETAKVTLEITFAPTASIMPARAGGAKPYLVENCYIRHDMITVTDAYQAEFARAWTSRTLTFLIQTVHVHTEIFATGADNTTGDVTAPRGFTNLMAVVAAFRHAGSDHVIDDRGYPGPSPQDNDQAMLKYRWSLGSQSYPSYDIGTRPEAYAQWKEYAGGAAVQTGLTYEGADDGYFRDGRFVIAQRLSRCGLLASGANTYVGDLIRLDVSNLRAVDDRRSVCRLYLFYSASISIGRAGVSVTD